jgi:hypothetical protein
VPGYFKEIVSESGSSKTRYQTHTEQIPPEADGGVDISRGHCQVIDSGIFHHIITPAKHILFAIPARAKPILGLRSFILTKEPFRNVPKTTPGTSVRRQWSHFFQRTKIDRKSDSSGDEKTEK